MLLAGRVLFQNSKVGGRLGGQYGMAMSGTGESEQTLRAQEWLGASLESHVITAAARDLYALWRMKRSMAEFVSRRDMDIVELSPWIGRLTVYDYIYEEDDYLCRLFGEALRKRIGMDLTRRRFTELPAPIGERLRARYDRVRTSGLPLLCHVLTFVVELGIPQNERLPAELLALPLSRSNCGHDCILVLHQPLD